MEASRCTSIPTSGRRSRLRRYWPRAGAFGPSPAVCKTTRAHVYESRSPCFSVACSPEVLDGEVRVPLPPKPTEHPDRRQRNALAAGRAAALVDEAVVAALLVERTEPPYVARRDPGDVGASARASARCGRARGVLRGGMPGEKTRDRSYVNHSHPSVTFDRAAVRP